MKIRHLFVLTLVLAFALTVPGALLAQDGPSAEGPEKAKATAEEKAKADKDKAEALAQAAQQYIPPSNAAGALWLGASYNDNDGNLNRVGEYNVLEDGGLPQFTGSVWGNSGKTFYDLYGQFKGDAADQRYVLDADFARYVQAHAHYKALPHRLNHDPLSYLDASVGNFVVRYDDAVPGREFDLKYGDLDARATITVPGAEALSFGVGFNRQTRSGYHQSITSSKCSNCHVSGTVAEMDQVTDSVDVNALLELTNVSLEYIYRHRTFSENAPTLTNTFDAPLHPASLAPVFGNRIMYWDTDGPQPIGQIPDKTKQSHLFRVTGRVPQKLSVQGAFSYTDLTNDTTGVGSNAKGFKGRVAVPLEGIGTIVGTVRYYNVEVDDIFVDLPEPVSLAGPTAGKTYSEFYPAFGETDFLRQSVRNRRPLEFILDFNTKLGRRTNLKVGYEREQLEREHFEVEETTTDKFKLNLRSRFGGDWRLRFRWEEAWVNDAFAHVHGAIPAVVQGGPSPGKVPFFGLQYFQMYDARQANLSSRPSRKHLVDPSLTWAPSARASVTFNYRYRGLSNDELNFSDWERTMHSPGISFWYAPTNMLQVTAGYNYLRDQSKTLYSVLAFDG